MKTNHQIIVILSVVLCQALIGCRSFETHPWTSPDNAMVFPKKPPVLEQDRLYVSPDHLYRPIADQVPAAASMLSETSFVRLTWDQFETFTGVSRSLEINVNPYLVRAVAWSVSPWYALVYFDRETNILYTEHVTYNGEMYIPGDHRSNAAPIIALLDHAPTEVGAYAIWDGDGGLTHMDSPHAWKED